MKPTEPGLYIFERTIVLIEKSGRVFNVLGKNDYVGMLVNMSNEGWGEKLDLDYDP